MNNLTNLNKEAIFKNTGNKKITPYFLRKINQKIIIKVC